MSQQRFADMSETEFDALIEGHIERTATGAGELLADVFLDVLLELCLPCRAVPRTSRLHRAGLCGLIDIFDESHPQLGKVRALQGQRWWKKGISPHSRFTPTRVRGRLTRCGQWRSLHASGGGSSSA
jgi:hypothetical protein